MKPERTLIAFLHAKPEKRDELLEILLGFIKRTRGEAGCVDYHLHVSDSDPNQFVFYENWRTRGELKLHQQSAILDDFWPRRLEFLQKDVEIKILTMLSEPN